jgi:hypothetical protein
MSVASGSDPSRSLTDRGRAIVRILLILVAVGPALIHTRAFLTMFELPGDIDPFVDATTYQAAGERLNAGHDLYRLQEGDRPVLLGPGVPAPLLSPPLIAAIWRPISAMSFGFAAWVVACWVAVLGTMVYLVLRTGLVGVAACLILAEPIGNQLAVANVGAFFPLLTVLVWNRRSRPWSGALVGVMAAVKLSPAALFASRHLASRRDQLAAGLVAIAVTTGIGVLGAGLGTLTDYVGVAAATRPSLPSLSGTFGLPWLSFVVLIGGSLAALLVRNQALSFSIALAASVFGNPALYEPGYVPLLALAAPAIGSRYVWPASRATTSTSPVHAAADHLLPDAAS